MNRVPDIQTRASFHKQLYYFNLSGADCLVERRRVGMKSVRVVAVRILPRVEQQLDNLGVTVLGSQRQSDVSALTVRLREHSSRFCDPAKAGHRGKVAYWRTAPGQRLCRAQISERQ